MKYLISLLFLFFIAASCKDKTPAYDVKKDAYVNRILDSMPQEHTVDEIGGDTWCQVYYPEMKISVKFVPERRYKNQEHWEYSARDVHGNLIFWIGAWESVLPNELSDSTLERMKALFYKLVPKKEKPVGYNKHTDSLVNKLLDSKPKKVKISIVDGETWYQIYYPELKFGIKHVPKKDYKSVEHWEYGAVNKKGENVFLTSELMDLEEHKVSPLTLYRLRLFCLDLKN